MVIFLMAVFSGLGLSMIFLSQTYLKMNGYRRFSTFLDYASENGAKRGFADLAAWLSERGRLAAVSAAAVDAFRAAPASGFGPLLEEAVGPAFPRVLSESAGSMSWECLSTCVPIRFEDRGDYVRIEAALTIESAGAVAPLRPRRLSRLEGTVGILAGRFPLSALPLLIDKEPAAGADPDLLKSNGISFAPPPGNVLHPAGIMTGGGQIPGDASPQVSRALKVKVLSPADLSNALLRQALGLEPSEAEIPDGVYLIRTDEGLGGVFVQGDLDELVLAIDGSRQVVVFRSAAGEWRLTFDPAASHTEFATPDGTASYDRVPLGMIVVEGGLASVGGGIVGADGAVAMVEDGEIPCVLSGVSLSIVASGRVVLSSNIILQDVTWQEGIPVVKESQSQVVIFSSGSDFQTGEAVDGGVTVAADAPDALKVHASLTAGGGGFEIAGAGKTVEVMGGLQTSDYRGNGNSLRITPDARAARGILTADSPLTGTPQLAVISLRILAWREYE